MHPLNSLPVPTKNCCTKNQTGQGVGAPSELSQSDGNLECVTGANKTEMDLQNLGKTLRFPMLIRALAGVPHK